MRAIWFCCNNVCSCKFLLSSKRQFPLSFSLSIPPPEKEGKTEKEKGFQKEKIKKKGTKNRKNFLQFFPVDPLHLLPKKEEKREEITKFSFSISHSQTRKNREKKKEKGQNEMKVGRKRRLLSFPFPVPIPQKERKKRRKKKKRKRKKKNGRKYVSSQGCGKQKDLAYLSIDKV